MSRERSATQKGPQPKPGPSLKLIAADHTPGSRSLDSPSKAAGSGIDFWLRVGLRIPIDDGSDESASGTI
jgi:hypothetical protein